MPETSKAVADQAILCDVHTYIPAGIYVGSHHLVAQTPSACVDGQIGSQPQF
jgi:hypothetical protein